MFRDKHFSLNSNDMTYISKFQAENNKGALLSKTPSDNNSIYLDETT